MDAPETILLKENPNKPKVYKTVWVFTRGLEDEGENDVGNKG